MEEEEAGSGGYTVREKERGGGTGEMKVYAGGVMVCFRRNERWMPQPTFRQRSAFH